MKVAECFKIQRECKMKQITKQNKLHDSPHWKIMLQSRKADSVLLDLQYF